MSVIGDMLVYLAVIIVTILVFNFLYYVPKYLGELVYIISHILGIETEIIYEDDENNKN